MGRSVINARIDADMLFAAFFGERDLFLPLGETCAVFVGAFGIASRAGDAFDEMC